MFSMYYTMDRREIMVSNLFVPKIEDFKLRTIRFYISSQKKRYRRNQDGYG